MWYADALGQKVRPFLIDVGEVEREREREKDKQTNREKEEWAVRSCTLWRVAEQLIQTRV